ncbi:MAG: phosphate ABC transporter substrate-binding protein [Betaproteobacteria bacterium]|nr:phosphate ABC transporter substrate-binding protein [Betaproteobacteria bacterium]
MRAAAPVTQPRLSIALGLLLGLSVGSAAAEVVVVVSKNCPVTALTREQVVDIFLGKASRFPDGTRAVPIDHLEGSALRDEFYLKFAVRSPAQVKAHWSKIIFTGRGQPPQEIANAGDLKKVMAENPNAIGYIEQNLVDASVKVLLAQ